MIRSLAPAARLVVLAGLALAACSTPATRPSFSDIRFTGEAPLNLAVARIDLVDRFQPSFKDPEVEYLFPVPPARAAENWAHDRLRAVGSKGIARVLIEDASVRGVALPKKSTGVSAAFTTEPAERYDGSVAMRVDILDDRGLPVRTAEAKATRSQSTLEGITPNQRDQVWYDMTKAMMADLDKELERQIRRNFGYYLQ